MCRRNYEVILYPYAGMRFGLYREFEIIQVKFRCSSYSWAGVYKLPLLFGFFVVIVKKSENIKSSKNILVRSLNSKFEPEIISVRFSALTFSENTNTK